MHTLDNIWLEVQEKACDDAEREVWALAMYGAIAYVFDASGHPLLVVMMGCSSVIVGIEENKSRLVEGPLHDGIYSKRWIHSLYELCTPETLLRVNTLFEELQISVWNKREVMNTLTSSTSDECSSNLHIKEPKLGHPTQPHQWLNTASCWLGDVRGKNFECCSDSFDISRDAPTRNSAVDINGPCLSQPFWFGWRGTCKLGKREPSSHWWAPVCSTRLRSRNGRSSLAWMGFMRRFADNWLELLIKRLQEAEVGPSQWSLCDWVLEPKRFVRDLKDGLLGQRGYMW